MAFPTDQFANAKLFLTEQTYGDISIAVENAVLRSIKLN